MSKNVFTFDIDMSYKFLSKTKAKDYKSLSTKKDRDEFGLFLAEGNKCVLDMLPFFMPEALLVTEEWIEHHKEIAETYHDNILVTDKRGISMVSSLRSIPDVIAVFVKPQYKDIDNIKEGNLYLLLDEIQDPGNLGTIVRTCDWFGIYDIYASKNTVDVFSPKVVQSTMGSLSRVSVHYTDLESLISRNRNLKVYGSLLNGKSLKTFNSGCHGFLLMGNEGRGISEDLRRFIDIPITIPPVNPEAHPDSLNVAIATAIILSHFSSFKS